MNTYNKIQLLIDNGEYDQAENLLEKMAEKDSCEYWKYKAVLEQKKQNWGAAINAWQRICEIDPGNKEATMQKEVLNNILSFRNIDQLNP